MGLIGLIILMVLMKLTELMDLREGSTWLITISLARG